MSRGTIKKVAGPLVIAKGMRDANMYDVVRVSSQRLIGEIIEMHEDEASIQVYEETSGLRPGEPVESMEVPLSVELGPGLITSIYDGIQRPLDDIMKVAGSNNLKRGVEVPALKRDKKWNFIPVAKVGDQLEGGDVLGTVQETIVVTQKIMVPPNMKGTLKEIKSGEFTVDETVAVLSTADALFANAAAIERHLAGVEQLLLYPRLVEPHAAHRAALVRNRRADPPHAARVMQRGLALHKAGETRLPPLGHLCRGKRTRRVLVTGRQGLHQIQRRLDPARGQRLEANRAEPLDAFK